MNECKRHKRIVRPVAWLLCLALLAALMPGFSLPMEAEAAAEKTTFGEYATLAKVYEQDGCFSMQGMAVHENYIYACKTNNGTDTKAVVARININDGSKVFLTNASTGTYVFEDFVHGNEIEVERIGGALTMFIPTMASGSESLIRYKISGTTATRVGNYTMTYNGSNISGGAIRVMHYSENYITFIFKSGNSFYTGKIPVNQYSGTVAMSLLFNFNYTTLYHNGVAQDITGFSLQGFEYYDGKIYLPLSGHAVSGMVNVSIIQVYDIQGIVPGCTLDPERNLNFYVASEEYPAYFEMESCGISPRTGKMYFNTNSRRTNSDTNHDGVHYFTDWEYEPSQRNTDVNNYRWEVIGDKLTSVSTNGSALNHAIMLQGTVSGGEFTLCRYATDRTIVLEHDRPWEVEWKSSGVSTGSMLFATEGDCACVDAPYIYRRGGKSIIAMGVYDGQYNQDYGVDLSLYGIDESQTHVYRLSNRLNADGSNMVYLSVDGKELGPMNNHYVNGYDQGTTSNWVSGRDFRFSYFGPYNYRLDGIKLSYIQVWGNGEKYDPNGIYRWETKNGVLSAVQGGSIPTLTSGSVSGITHTTAQHSLSQGVTLMHDQPWTIRWIGEGSGGGGSLLASDNRGDCNNSRYLMRNGTAIFFGYRDGSNHQQYGINPTDYGVDMDAEHIFTLQNKVNADGSNMVYLSVDGRELGAMNRYYKNGSSQNSTSNWISGKDFSFNWMGTLPYSVNKQTLRYMQIWENGIPQTETVPSYRWETVQNTLTSITTNGFTSNPVYPRSVSVTNGTYSTASFTLDQPVVLRHDRPWQIQWESSGSNDASGMILASVAGGEENGSVYLFRNTNLIGFGTYGSRHEQWGISLSKHGIDHTVSHTYAIRNVINDDGSNTAWFYLDGQKLAPMEEHFVYGSATSDPASNWINGRDLTFCYIGNDGFPIKNTALSYIQISEGCDHAYTDKVTAPTCTAQGYTTHTCALCGDSYTDSYLEATGHSYKGVVTAPTCTAQGYTTYTCSACGSSYRGDYVSSVPHNYVAKVTKAPTCTSTGICTYDCSGCDRSYTQSIPMTGHNYQSVVTAPSCTTPGHTTHTCTVCGDSYQDGDTEATGHSYQAVVTPPTCTAAGYTTYTCPGCGDSYTADPTSAAGHHYEAVVTAPTCTTSGYTTYTCTVCGSGYTGDRLSATGHSYENGTCTACGEADPDYVPTVTQPTLKLRYPTLTFEDVITMNIMFEASALEDVVEMGLITYKQSVPQWNVDNADFVCPGYYWDSSLSLYVASTNGIPAKEMGDEIWFAAYAKLADGTYSYTPLVSYSPTTYAYSQLSDPSMSNLVIAMLNYGAAAQVYFGHNVDSLMNAGLTDEQKASIETYRADMMNGISTPDAKKMGAFAASSVNGFERKYPTISFEGAFSIDYFCIPNKAPVGDVTLYYWNQDDYDAADTLTADNATDALTTTYNGSMYETSVEGIAAKDLDKGVYVAFVYSDGTNTYCSGILGYSIGMYCTGLASGGDAMASFAQATAVYGYYAKEMFY